MAGFGTVQRGSWTGYGDEVVMGNELAQRLEEDLSEVAQARSKQFAERVRSNLLESLEADVQGSGGLADYVSEVEQDRDSGGRFVSDWKFEINHPTAPLHETGGNIEPTYSKAQVRGWTRDEFYEALKDCNSYVEKKRLVRSAEMEAINNE